MDPYNTLDHHRANDSVECPWSHERVTTDRSKTRDTIEYYGSTGPNTNALENRFAVGATPRQVFRDIRRVLDIRSAGSVQSRPARAVRPEASGQNTRRTDDVP